MPTRHLVPKSIVVQENEAFEQDALDRSYFGQSLLNLVLQTNDKLVISLDGQWGEGKTTFVKMWQGMLDKTEVPNIYIDAFANDYIDDAFIAIASSITTYIEENSTKIDKNKAKEFSEKAKQVGVQLLSWTSKVAIKAATLGAINGSDIEELQDIKSDLAKGVSTAIGDFVGKRLASHKQNVEVLQSFKNLLSEIPQLIYPEGNKPLVIIIDELDRCKPTYSLELIEKIKHLFSVKKIVFILVMHRKQIEESVKCIYGQNIDAHTYLQKFINIETTIPKKNKDYHDNDIYNYIDNIFNLNRLEIWGDDKGNLTHYLNIIAMHLNLSLRQLERVYTNLAIFYTASSDREFRHAPVICFLAIIKVVNPFLYESLSNQRIAHNEILQKSGLPWDDKQYKHQKDLDFLSNWLKFLLMTDKQFNSLSNDNKIKNYCTALLKYGLERNEVIPLFVKKLNMFTAV